MDVHIAIEKRKGIEMGKEVVIKGVVMQEVLEGENPSAYKIKSGEQEYSVISEGNQAIRDWIFIRKGQSVVVKGEEKKDKVFSKKSKIILEKEKK